MQKKSIAIIGGGPAALSAAYFLSSKFEITIYEKEKSIGQKFLVAGKGGFNLTNSLIGNELSLKIYSDKFSSTIVLIISTQVKQESG